MCVITPPRKSLFLNSARQADNPPNNRSTNFGNERMRENAARPLIKCIFIFTIVTTFYAHNKTARYAFSYEDTVQKLTNAVPPVAIGQPPPSETSTKVLEDQAETYVLIADAKYNEVAPTNAKQIAESLEEEDQRAVIEETPTQAPIIGEKARCDVPIGSTPLYNTTKGVVEGIVDFERQDRVVFATKIHGFYEQVEQLIQSICLFTQAYNRKVNYDIVVFSTLPISEEWQKKIQDVASPAKVTVVPDEQTLEDQLRDLSEEQLKTLIDRCDNVTSIEDFLWWKRCSDEISKMPLAYTWMSEFRSKQIWTQEVLAPYKYMLWMDTDAFCTKEWKQDPVAFMIRNNLVVLYANFPQGALKMELPEVHGIIRKVYGKSLCGVQSDSEGKSLSATVVKEWDEHIDPKDLCEEKKIAVIHGFMHITDLDFYRSDINMKFYDKYIGDGKFRRSRDDQGAVTIPAAILAPERSWDMRNNGLQLKVAHNSHFDGKEFLKCGGFRRWWLREIKQWKVYDRMKWNRDEVIDVHMMKCRPYIKAKE